MLLRKRILLMSILLQVVLLVPVTQGSANADNNYQYILTELAQVDTNFFAFDIEIVDNIAYIADADFISSNPGGLVIVNVSDPMNPVKLSSYYDSQGFPSDICIKDGLAFVADRSDGLEVINVTDPLNPQEIETGYTDASMVDGVKVLGDVAFIADNPTGLHIVNITNPSNLTRINRVSLLGACVAVEIADNFAYVIDHRSIQSGLIIYNISNIHSIVEVGNYMPYADFIHPYVHNGLVIVANHQLNAGELRILNISNPSDIHELSQFKGEGDAQKSRVVNQTLCMTDSDFGIKLLNISNPSEPFVIGKYNDDSGVAFDAQIIGDIIFVADGSDGLEIIQISRNENYQPPTAKLSTPIIFLIIFGLSIIAAHYCVRRKKRIYRRN